MTPYTHLSAQFLLTIASKPLCGVFVAAYQPNSSFFWRSEVSCTIRMRDVHR
eukprot:m.17752 g.17752  ORF g.17752 m.17752 type:complete len:52 (+) comp11658_c0_seq1:1150-1305(+)